MTFSEQNKQPKAHLFI